MTGQREPTPWQRRLPNRLTGLRVALAGLFFLVLTPYQYGLPVEAGSWVRPFIGALIFVLAALTDALDGHLARKWGVVSIFGRVMDPFADKILVLGAFVMLAGPGFRHVWLEDVFSGARPNVFASWAMWWVQASGTLPLFAIIILARELLVTTLRGLVEARGGDFSAIFAGKLKMIVQSVAVPAVLLLVAWQERRMPFHSLGLTSPPPPKGFDPILPTKIAWWIMIVTTFVTAWSAIPYITRAILVLRVHGPEQK